MYVSRKNAGAMITPKTAIEIHIDGPTAARAASSTMIAGNAINIPASQVDTLSNQRP